MLYINFNVTHVLSGTKRSKIFLKTWILDLESPRLQRACSQ